MEVARPTAMVVLRSPVLSLANGWWCAISSGCLRDRWTGNQWLRNFTAHQKSKLKNLLCHKHIAELELWQRQSLLCFYTVASSFLQGFSSTSTKERLTRWLNISPGLGEIPCFFFHSFPTALGPFIQQTLLSIYVLGLGGVLLEYRDE